MTLTALDDPSLEGMVEMRDAISQIVAAEWCGVLGLAEVERHDDFFASGGDSMSGMVLLARLEHRFAIELPTDILFIDGTFAALVLACVDAVEPSKRV